MILFELAETATILAALRFYQRGLEVKPSSDVEYWFDEIATDGGTLEPLDSEGIDELINKIQLANRE